MEPILLDFPTEFTTERLLLRLPQPGDGEAVNSAICHSIEELKPYMQFAQEMPKEEDTEKNIRKAYAKFILRQDMRFLIFHKEEGHFIGSIALHHPHWDIPKFEIGYWLDARQTGKGNMTEALIGLTEFAFHEIGAKRLELLIAVINEKSRKVAEQAGYELEGILKNEDRLPDGRLMDSRLYVKNPD